MGAGVTDSRASHALDTAWRIHGALVDWTGKVDSKASFTVGVESAALAGVITLSASSRCRLLAVRSHTFMGRAMRSTGSVSHCWFSASWQRCTSYGHGYAMTI